MRIRLCGQEDTPEVEESLGRRLCEQGKAVPSSTTAARRSPFPIGEGCGETEGRTARKRGKRNGAGGEDKDGQ